MTVEIVSVSLNKGIVSITAVDCSDENLQRMERIRDDGFEKEVEFTFDTHRKNDFRYLLNWMKSQKTARRAETWGEALSSIYGTVTTIDEKYRVWS